VDTSHAHPPEGRCTPGCPRWSETALQFYALQQRWQEMLDACRAASAIDWVMVAPNAPGVELPDYLKEEELVRLNLLAGRDAPEVLLDEWGIRCTLTFRGSRFDCAMPWPSILAGALRPPERRFGVIQGGRKD